MQPGVYIHYKLNRYLFIGQATFTGNGEFNGLPMALYYPMHNDGLPITTIRVRPEFECNESVDWVDGIKRARFFPEKDLPRAVLDKVKAYR